MTSSAYYNNNKEFFCKKATVRESERERERERERGGGRILLRSMGWQAFRLRRRCKVQSSSGVLKEKRARLYIIRRCILMLICWRDQKDK
ncbi:hypothetical protein ACB092_06G276200 [Castanea dentata]